MKEDRTKFTCDQCGGFKDGCKEFPYAEGWLYMYNYNIQRNLEGKVERISKMDKHFCSEECLIKYLEYFNSHKDEVKK